MEIGLQERPYVGVLRHQVLQRLDDFTYISSIFNISASLTLGVEKRPYKPFSLKALPASHRSAYGRVTCLNQVI